LECRLARNHRDISTFVTVDRDPRDLTCRKIDLNYTKDFSNSSDSYVVPLIGKMIIIRITAISQALILLPEHLITVSGIVNNDNEQISQIAHYRLCHQYIARIKVASM